MGIVLICQVGGKKKKNLSQRKIFVEIMCLNPTRDSVPIHTEAVTGVKK